MLGFAELAKLVRDWERRHARSGHKQVRAAAAQRPHPHWLAGTRPLRTTCSPPPSRVLPRLAFTHTQTLTHTYMRAPASPAAPPAGAVLPL